MENYEKLIAEIDEVVKRIKGLYDLAYTQYSHAVDEVISGRLTDEKQIEHILDGIIDFGDDLRFLELSKRLCRHIYYEYPQLVSFICTERCLRKRRTKMELVTIEVKLPKEVYDSASEILAKQGLTMEDALILFLKETVRLGRIPFDYTEADLEEVRRWERIVNDDVQDTEGEETCMVN